MKRLVPCLPGFLLLLFFLLVAGVDAFAHRLLQSGSELDYPPFALVTPTGEAEGFSVELLKAVVQSVDMDVNFHTGPWQRIKQELIDGKIDVLPFVSDTKERAQYFDFTIPYVKMHGTIFVRKGDKRIRGENDLKDKEVVVMQGDVSHEYALRRNLSNHLVLTKDFAEAFRLLASGRHDAVIAQQIVGWQLVRQLGLSNLVDVSVLHDQSLRPFGKPLADFEQKFCIAVRKGDSELLALLNEGLATVIANGTYDALYAKWFGPILPARAVDPTALARALAFTLVPCLLLLSLAGLWYLRREVRRKTLSLRQEIEERKRVEAELRIIADSIYDWEYWRAPDGGYLWVSPSCQTMTGYTAQQFTGESAQKILHMVHPEDKPIWERHLLEVDSRHPEHRELDLRIVTAAGEVVWISHTCKPIFDADGTYRGRRGCNRDITRRKWAEAALAQSEERYRLLFANAGDAIYLSDADGRLVDVNEEASRQTGFSREELTRMAVYDVDANETAQSFATFTRELATHNSWAFEAQHRQKGGDVFPVEIKGVRLDTKAGPLVMGIVRNISERKLAETKLLAMKERAEAASKSKSEFLANMSHEIRTPLNGVLGMLQLLQLTEPTAEQQEYLLGAVKSAKRLTRLLADILDLSRIEAGKMRIDQVPWTMDSLRESILELFWPAAREKGLALDFTIDPGIAPRLLGDEARVRQILFNLVGNALKFTDQGSVTVTATPLSGTGRADARILFRVRDTGIGISDAELSSIFDPFVQAEDSYTRPFQGAGLGLSIVRKLVRLMHGALAVDNTPGEGTTIYLVLPFGLPRAAADLSADAASSGPPRDTMPLRILIAEDDDTSRVAGRRMLEKRGHAVTTAVDGQDALNILEKQDFDLILMDIQMPVLDGVAAVRAIRGSGTFDDKAGIPIIAMTSYAMAGDREKFLAAGLDDYIAKPVDAAELNNVVARVMALKRQV
ncbi:transporter substrate-binding domain-containing protein [Desulfovibrio aerotolerans]|uniref:histidine kinase n=1 Tax=Solidesulfovibrio aerotolerans TaxID=295255 RepID=A0A7C9INU9_9BACT|nr:transporter substrate-binding domain-containing protein [Solidesulfovibrio aerotolerans]MYL84526.1 transporter substrate-binding domain-containing protein [Solidesulfovibrio aerotolerans]